MALAGQVVDTPAAKEFLEKALEHASREDCRDIATDCGRRASMIQALLNARGSAPLDDAGLRQLLLLVFATRRRADRVLSVAAQQGGLARLLTNLCSPDGTVGERIDRFVDALSALDDLELACDLAGEVLHATQPDRYWLFSRWIWSSKHRTGALALVTTDADLSGATPGQTYALVGRALTMLRASGDAAGLLDLGPEPWNLDVLLACVYCVYLYTVTRLRMTQEFNKVIPPLPDLARRFLGVHRLEGLSNVC
jgi:hypothetical protein